MLQAGGIAAQPEAEGDDIVLRAAVLLLALCGQGGHLGVVHTHHLKHRRTHPQLLLGQGAQHLVDPVDRPLGDLVAARVDQALPRVGGQALGLPALIGVLHDPLHCRRQRRARPLQLLGHQLGDQTVGFAHPQIVGSGAPQRAVGGQAGQQELGEGL
jgi:hypothetical protein